MLGNLNVKRVLEHFVDRLEQVQNRVCHQHRASDNVFNLLGWQKRCAAQMRKLMGNFC